MTKNLILINKHEYSNVDERELLNEISILIQSNIELLNVVIEGVDENQKLLGTLEVLERDLSTTNNYILKYLFDN